MLDPKRAIISIIFVVSMACTLVFAFFLDSKILIIISICVQFSSLVWYVLSYIPYGRQMCKKCLKACCCGGDSDEKSSPII